MLKQWNSEDVSSWVIRSFITFKSEFLKDIFRYYAILCKFWAIFLIPYFFFKTFLQNVFFFKVS